MAARPTGTTPDGVANEQEAARWVQGMFAQVAPKYDLLNHVLSLNIDRLWRARTVRRLLPILRNPDAKVLDLCCGTGDLLVELERAAGRPLLGSDFCLPMLEGASAKLRQRNLASRLFDGDGLALPLADASLDLITIAFGFRNFANYHAGLVELHRVLKPGGTLALLEFSHPPNRLIRVGYQTYSHHVLPRLGALISGSRNAYRYLPRSVQKFPPAPELVEWLRGAGFAEAEYTYMTLGVVALHLGRKST
ncbi:MAG: bifunctional demethylmenaquinone methyltransferase/2-methoxy-6-polyprenyl-1,4-benzoquinol methylase UbiE [Bryobacterales bacterium]|nr:bifunctional demethylmenaquinone methyltransferase/2-methoxy-6-polyprenyl-1,4-benzoquinol methylase UbiE [Bryobacterales bacterium]